jgi:hypothetical protein
MTLHSSILRYACQRKVFNSQQIMRQRTASVILYLDFDGVLHDEDVWWHKKYGIYLRTPGRTLFEWMQILEKILEKYPSVKIVLATTWVAKRSFRYALKKLSPPLRQRVIGATFHHREMDLAEFMARPRGIQILGDVSRRAPLRWIALDDDDEDWPLRTRANLVLTKGSLGLSDPDVQKVLHQKLKEIHDELGQSDTEEE